MRGNDRTTKKENSIKEGERKQWINKKKKTYTRARTREQRK